MSAGEALSYSSYLSFVLLGIWLCIFRFSVKSLINREHLKSIKSAAKPWYFPNAKPLSEKLHLS